MYRQKRRRVGKGDMCCYLIHSLAACGYVPLPSSTPEKPVKCSRYSTYTNSTMQWLGDKKEHNGPLSRLVGRGDTAKLD